MRLARLAWQARGPFCVTPCGERTCGGREHSRWTRSEVSYQSVLDMGEAVRVPGGCRQTPGGEPGLPSTHQQPLMCAPVPTKCASQPATRADLLSRLDKAIQMAADGPKLYRDAPFLR